MTAKNHASRAGDIADQPPDNGDSQQGLLRRIRVTTEIKNKLQSNLKLFCELLWEKELEGLHLPIGMFTNSFFLPDKYLQCLVQGCGSITDIEGLAQVLARQKVDLQFSSIGPYVQQLLELIVSTVHTRPDHPQPISAPPTDIAPAPPQAEGNWGLETLYGTELETQLGDLVVSNEPGISQMLPHGSIPNNTSSVGVRR